MKITTGQEASHYYNVINSAIDKKYIPLNISPIKLRNYLKYGSDNYKRFLTENNLDDCDDIKKIIQHVLDDRVSIVHDIKNENIMMFEEFQSAANAIDYEKVLADYYNTSLGHVIPQGANKYSINSFGDLINVLIYSEKEMITIYNNYINTMIDEYSAVPVKINQTILMEVTNGDVMDYEKIKTIIKSKLNKRTLIELISKREGYKYKGYNNKYYIWQKEGI